VKRSRITLARLMVVVGVIALETAGFRALYQRTEELALGLALTGLASQIGLFCAVRGSGRSRAFWSGFAVIGAVMMATFAWGISVPGSGMYHIWSSYTGYADDALSSLFPYEPRWLPQDVAPSVIWSLPQLLAAMIGGLLAAFVMRQRVRAAGGRRIGSATP